MNGAISSARRRRAQRLRAGERCQPLAERAVADLVVVLETDHERRRWQMRAPLATRLAAMRRYLALIGEALRHAAGKQPRCVLKILVIALMLAGEHDVDAMMPVIGPLRVEQPRRKMRGFVALVFEHEMDVAAGLDCARGSCAPSRQGNPAR